MSTVTPSLDLYWIPLGAGARVVRTSGRIYESLAAWYHHRPRSDLYHAALVATTEAGAYSVEVAPIPDAHGHSRGVVGEGAVGLAALGRFRLFRYEIRCWLDGDIPDLQYAIDSPVQLSCDTTAIAEVLALLPAVPRPVWGRDELGAGDMWNSNSVVAWVLAHASLLDAAGRPPRGGRAPGWDAGVTIALRSGRPLAAAVR